MDPRSQPSGMLCSGQGRSPSCTSTQATADIRSLCSLAGMNGPALGPKGREPAFLLMRIFLSRFYSVERLLAGLAESQHGSLMERFTGKSRSAFPTVLWCCAVVLVVPSLTDRSKAAPPCRCASCAPLRVKLVYPGFRITPSCLPGRPPRRPIHTAHDHGALPG